ncbi:MAG: hypothetical protein O7A98_10300, partial [Acidobacteria bacterium]|nr:hypothetical protein [Acidobacteriota bacterium]
VDEELGLNLRFNWIYEPGADLFVVFNQSWNAPDALSTLERIDHLIPWPGLGLFAVGKKCSGA